MIILLFLINIGFASENNIQEQKLVNELTSGLSQQDIIFQKELITVFEPFPLRRVYQERLINLYGNEEAEKAYKKMIEMNKLPVMGSGYQENKEWLRELSLDRNRQKYLKIIHNLNNVVLMSPFRFNAIDDDCWIIVTLNSTRFEGIELLRELSTNFYEKCAIGVVDITFPSNYDLFKTVLENTRSHDDGPAVMLKKNKQKMVEFEFHAEPEVKWNSFLLPVQKWGQILSNAQVNDKYFVQNTLQYLYNGLTDNEKLAAIYTPLNVLENPGKDLMYFLIQAYGKQREKAVSEQIERDIKSKIFKIGSPEHIAAVNLLMEKYNYENSLKAFLKKELKRRNNLIQEDLKSGIEYVQRFYPAQNPDFSLYEPYVEDYTFLK